MPKIAVDAMGGDRAPQVVVEGAVLAAQNHSVEIVLVGDKEAIERELAKQKDAPRFSIAPEAKSGIAIRSNLSPG